MAGSAFDGAIGETPPAGADMVIIGAGIIGSSIALQLARRGHRVVIVDREGAPAQGSTGASAGIVRIHAESLDAVHLADEALGSWRHWAEFLQAPADEPLAQFEVCGSVILEDRTGYADRVAQTMAAAGVPFEWWDQDLLAEQLPDFDLRAFGPPRLPGDPAFWDEPDRSLTGAAHTPQTGYVTDPGLAGQNVFRAAIRAGAEFVPRAAVAGIVQRGSEVRGVDFRDGRHIATPVVVNAAGPHSSLVNDLAGISSTMNVTSRPMRQELHELPMPGELRGAAGMHIVDGDLGVNFRPGASGAVLVGGNGAVCDPEEWIDDPDDFNAGVTVAAWERDALRLARRIPRLRIPSRPSGIAGLYDVTPDWMPIYDATDLGGFFVAAGSSGNQFKTAPIVGLLMAELIEAVANGRDTDREPLEVPGPHTGRLLRLAPYSRLRKPVEGGVRG